MRGDLGTAKQGLDLRPSACLLEATTSVADTAAGVFLPRVRLVTHDALLDFCDQAQEGVDPQAGDDKLEDDPSVGDAVVNGSGRRIVVEVDGVDDGVDSDSKTDQKPNGNDGQHGDIVHAGPDEASDGHCQAYRGNDDVQGDVGIRERDEGVVVDGVHAWGGGTDDGKDQGQARSDNEDDGDDDNGPSVVAAATACDRPTDRPRRGRREGQGENHDGDDDDG